MPLNPQDQFDIITRSWTTGDFDTLSKLLTTPDAITLDEKRSVAEQLGMKKGFLSAAVNIATDPTVWAAMFLSRKFPHAQYLKGTVPHRMIGTSAEFSGLSSVARTVEGFFRGTNIPRLLSLKMKREAEVIGIGNKIFDEIAVRPNWKEEMPVVSMILEGERPAGATSELYAFAGRIRQHMNDLWGFLSRTQKVSGGFDSPHGLRPAVAGPFPADQAPRFLRDYLPHIPLLGPESVIEVSGREAIARMGKSKAAQAIGLVGENPGQVWTPTASDRLTSNFQRYQTFMSRVGAQVFNPRLFRRKRFGVGLQSAEGEGLFVTDLNVILQRYIHSVARTYALNAPLSNVERAAARSFITDAAGREIEIRPTKDPVIVQIINEGLASAGMDPTRMIRRQVAGTNRFETFVDPRTLNAPARGALQTLVREVKGQMDESEALFGNLFNSIRHQASRTLGRFLPRKQNEELETAISRVQADAKGRTLSRRIASYFYSTTLGLNTASSLKNLFQPFLTTLPALGIGPTLEGYRVLKRRFPSYGAEFLKQNRLLRANPRIPLVERLNLAQERAFHQTFPELAAAGIKADPRAFELGEAAIIEETLRSGKGFRNPDAYFKFLLQPFTQSELSNQVVSFYGGKAAMRQALKRGEIDVPRLPGGETLTGNDLDQYLNLEAASLVNATQFRPGPGSRTPLQTLIPAPFRMFTSFPIRLANFFAESTVRGAMTEAQLKNAGFFERLTGGRNLGTIARTYVAGRTVTEGLRQTLGVDMSDAMGLTGPFTGIVQSGRIFSPLTFSPLPSVVAGMASFTSSRDLRDLNPLTLPVVGDVPIPKTLVPAGVTISRISRVMRAYRPDLGGFVDEDERLMYRGDTMDAVLGMLGVPLDKERRMREAVDRIQANRSRIRTYRRRYAVAARNYDTESLDRLQRQFREEFPEIGTLGVSQTDLRRYNQQASITVVQRILGTAGKQLNFVLPGIYEFDPELVAEGFVP